MLDVVQPSVLQYVMEHTHVAMYVASRDRKILFWNDGAERLTGYLRQDVIGRNCRDGLLVHCDESGHLLCGATECPLTEAMRDGKCNESQIILHHKNGHRIPVHVWTTPIRDEHGLVVGAAECFVEQSISSLHPRHPSLALHGCVDTMSGAANHDYTLTHLRESLNIHGQHQIPFGLLCIRIDQLDRFQTTYGRPGLDAILHTLAETVRHTLEPTDFLGRWTDDQFVAILQDCDSSDLDKTADAIASVLHRTDLRWWGDILTVTVSVGRAMVQAGDTIDTLIERAARSASSPGNTGPALYSISSGSIKTTSEG